MLNLALRRPLISLIVAVLIFAGTMGSATFLKNRGRLAVGGRYDDVSARNSTKNSGVNPITFEGDVTSTIEGARTRATPQAGLSFRVTEPVTDG